MSVLKSIVQAVRDLPPLSASCLELMRMFDDPSASLTDMARVVERDPQLTANVLRVVNSPAFGFGHSFNAIDRAVTFMGEQRIMSLAIGMCFNDFYAEALPGYGGAAGELWSHCLFTAVAARELAPLSVAGVAPGLAYTGGMLHDIGKLVLSMLMVKKGGISLPAFEEGDVKSALELEKLIMDGDHCEVGRALAKEWRLPEALGAAIGFHHAPAGAPTQWRALAYCVHVGNLMAMQQGAGTGLDYMRYPVDADFEAFIPLDGERYDALHTAAAREYVQMTKAMAG